jgi:3-carboxy-cis,cis-muconate cycloisomerase
MIDLSAHPWMRGLFGDDDIVAIFKPDAELKRILQIEAAWTRALGHVEAHPDADAVAGQIETANIATNDLLHGFSRDGVAIPALVKSLKAQLGPEAAQWVHRGLTSQDVMDTSLMLALQDVLRILMERLETLENVLNTLKDRFGVAPIMALTRMQPALETTAAEVIRRWQQPLPRLYTTLESLRQQSAQIQWGGPIGVRDHKNAAALGAEFAKQLGLNDPGNAWHTDRGMIADIANALVQVTTVIGKIGEDIALMAAIGPSQITLSGGGSSAMAHKNNPVKAEALIALSDYANVLQLSLARAARHEGFRSGRAWMLEWITLPQLALATGATTGQAIDLLNSIQTLGQHT